MLGLDRAHTFSSGSGKVVAVIDTGVQLNHPALSASLTTARYDFIDNDTTPDDQFNGLDDDGDRLVDEAAGHGTHVAGIIHLVAPAAKIMPIRALDSDGNGELFTVAKAINYAIGAGANVINLSLGSASKSSLLNDVIRPATLRGIVVVAAAGNLGVEADQYPASDQCAISVTSVGPNDIKSDFANYAGRVDFAAPGETIFSSFPPNGYARWSGTSMATPFVSGQAALLLSRRPTLNVRQVIGIIQATARPLDNLNPSFSGKLGDGRVNIGASLAFLAAGNAPEAKHGRISGSCVG
jgi:subtilisin family serine protease